MRYPRDAENPSWQRPIAENFNSLVRASSSLETVREWIGEFFAEREQFNRRRDDWQKRQQAHANTLLRNGGFAAEPLDRTPPSPGLAWESIHIPPQGAEEHANVVSGWTPVELCYDNAPVEPGCPWRWPFSHLSLVAKVTLLASIRDGVYRGVARLGPELAPTDMACRRIDKQVLAALSWPDKLIAATKLPESARESIEEFLREIRAELGQKSPPACGKNSAARQADRPMYDDCTPRNDGYVDLPTDPDAYIPIKDIVVAEHTPLELSIDPKKAKRIALDYPTNKIRWTHPRNKSGEPTKNRTCIHYGDWCDYIRRLSKPDDGAPHISEADVKARTDAIRKTKSPKFG
jgi:hypothetical protein